MIAISFKNKIYHVYDLLNKMTSEQTDFTSVINLCRLRLNKCKKHENDKDTLKNYAKLLYAQGCLISGVSVKDPAELSSLIVDLMIK